MGYPIFPNSINKPTKITPTRLDKVEKATTEGGYVQTRLKSSRAMHKYVLVWDAMPDWQLKKLIDFDAETGYGSKMFYWTLPERWQDSEAKMVRISGELSYPRVSRRAFSVTLTLEEV